MQNPSAASGPISKTFDRLTEELEAKPFETPQDV
jgi:hypothetical protein